MNFQIGDRVVHWPYGLGEIIQLEEKVLSGLSTLYYIVKIRDLMLWVPANELGESKLRYPTPASGFPELFAILKSPAEPLSDDRWDRKVQLTNQLKDGKLESVCRVIRDLTYYHRTKRKMNDQDNAILERVQNFLLNEWAASYSISVAQAKLELNQLLGEEIPQGS